MMEVRIYTRDCTYLCFSGGFLVSHDLGTLVRSTLYPMCTGSHQSLTQIEQMSYIYYHELSPRERQHITRQPRPRASRGVFRDR